MEFGKRFSRGVEWAYTSFKHALHYKKLLIYPAIAALCTLGLIIAFLYTKNALNLQASYNFFQQGTARFIADSFIGQIIFILLTTTINYLFLVALIKHYIAIKNNQPTSIINNINFAFSKLLLIIACVIVSAGISLMWSHIPKQGMDTKTIILWFITTLTITVWNILMIVLLPIITIERISFFNAVALATRVILARIPELIGGELLIIALSLVLALAAGGPIFLLAALPASAHIGIVLGLLTTFILSVYLNTARTLFGTLLYIQE